MTVSVVIPVYNAEKTLERCLDALISQTYTNFEVICVNDGSKDNSWQILEKYSHKDARIKVYNQENLGPAYTRHYAISKSCGEYLMFCDADDWYEPNMIEEMVSTIEAMAVDVVMCGADVIDLANGTIQNQHDIDYNKKVYTGYLDITPDLLAKINSLLWNKIFKKELIEKYNINYPTKYEHDDMVFIYNYFSVAKNCYGIDKELYHYYIGNENSIMGKLFKHNNADTKWDFIYAFDDNFKFLQLHPNIEFQEMIEKEFINKFFWWCVKFLDDNEKKEGYEKLRNFIINSDYTFINETINLIKAKKTYIDFIKYSKYKNLSLLQKLFSVTKFSIKNKLNYKILTILGIPIVVQNLRKKI